MDVHVGFVDAGFLHAEGARALDEQRSQLRVRADEVVAWLDEVAEANPPAELLRTYWYDAAFDHQHPEHGGQRRFLDAIGHTAGVQLRLGNVVERAPRIRRPLEEALRRTAEALDLDPDRVVTALEEHWDFRPERDQRGVDVLLTLDLVRLSHNRALDTAVVVAGDRWLAEVVRTCQDLGRRVLLALPRRQSAATELLQLADEVVEIPTAALEQMLQPRPE